MSMKLVPSIFRADFLISIPLLDQNLPMTEVTNTLNIDPSLLTHLVKITEKMKVDLQQVNSRMNVLEQKVIFYSCATRYFAPLQSQTNRCFVSLHRTHIIIIIFFTHSFPSTLIELDWKWIYQLRSDSGASVTASDPSGKETNWKLIHLNWQFSSRFQSITNLKLTSLWRVLLAVASWILLVHNWISSLVPSFLPFLLILLIFYFYFFFFLQKIRTWNKRNFSFFTKHSNIYTSLTRLEQNACLVGS